MQKHFRQPLTILALAAAMLPSAWGQAGSAGSVPPRKTRPGKTAASATTAHSKDTGIARGGARKNYSEQDKVSFEEEKKNAVIVAPYYLSSGLPTLKYTVNDASELKAELERQGYTVHLVPSTEATTEGVRAALVKEKTYLDGTKQATLLFAFMGHGFQNDSKKNFLMTYGADLNDFQKEALSLDEVEQLMDQTDARRKVILIDACRAPAGGARDVTKPRTMADFKVAEGTAVLLATAPGYSSYEYAELNHGTFTYFLLEGMRGKAAGPDGYVSFNDLSKYVEKSVSEFSEKKDEPQKPHASLHDVGGDFLMATAAPPKPDEIKENPVMSQISSDVPVMRAVGSKQSFYAILNGAMLTLIDAQTGQPFAILNEHPEEMTDKAAVASRSLRWFGGTGPNNTAINMVAEIHGAAILQIYGREGKACPNGNPCSATPYPLLPGEHYAQSAQLVNKAKRGATAVLNGAGTILHRKSAETIQTVANSSDAAEKSGLLQGDRDKYTWTTLDLASTMKLPPTPGTSVAQR